MAENDQGRDTLYVYNQGGRIVRITPAKIELVDNGTDDVLFMNESDATPFNLLESRGPDQEKNMFADLILGGLNPRTGILSEGDARLLLKLWIFSIFFPELMRTKPILALIGEKGSAKTMVARRIGRMLFGPAFDVTQLQSGSKDFDATVSNTALMVLDNVDTEASWLPDKLATLATGGKLRKRVLYTTNEMVTFTPRCFAIVTSRTPPFRRDDVADRSLILTTTRREDFLSETKMIRLVEEKRDAIMTELVHVLQDVVIALQDQQGDPVTGTFRMADFYDFSTQVGRQFGWEDAVKRSFDQLSKAQRLFGLEEDPMPDLLDAWLGIDGNAGRRVSARELFLEFGEIAKSRGMRKLGSKSSRAFAQQLPQLLPSLSEMFTVAKGVRKKTAVYSFGRKDNWE